MPGDAGERDTLRLRTRIPITRLARENREWDTGSKPRRSRHRSRSAYRPPPAPSKYAALGGFGPDGCRDGEYEIRDIHPVGNPYTLTSQALRVIALRADNAIGGHGKISVPQTWWALYNQVLTT